VPGGHGLPHRQPPDIRRTHSEALRDYWRDVKSGARTRKAESPEIPKDPNSNPLFDLPDEQKSRIYSWLRNCSYMDAAQDMLKGEGITGVSDKQIAEFNDEEGYHHWQMRIARGASEANAIVRLVEEVRPDYPAGILHGLGQEVFRQVSAGNMDPGVVTKLGAFFLKVRSDERTNLMQGLKRQKVERELEGSVHEALQNLSRQVQDQPAAREAFEALCHELNFETEEE
jgi:hypothetical protein